MDLAASSFESIRGAVRSGEYFAPRKHGQNGLRAIRRLDARHHPQARFTGDMLAGDGGCSPRRRREAPTSVVAR